MKDFSLVGMRMKDFSFGMRMKDFSLDWLEWEWKISH
jgi:hypothetical protein